MSWVEELKPDDDVKVEIIYPRKYVEYCLRTIRKYASGISLLCKGAVVLGDETTEFLVYDMTILQVKVLVQIMRQFGIEMEYDYGKLTNGTRWVYFYCDLQGLKEKMENGEFENDGPMQ